MADVKIHDEPKQREKKQRLHLNGTRLHSWNSIPGKVDSTAEKSILHLSDELILLILKYLPARDVVALGLSCQRFKYLISDYTLWIDVDLTHQRLLGISQILSRYTPLLCKSTRKLVTQGPLILSTSYVTYKNSPDYMCRHFMDEISKCCPNLESWILRYHCLTTNFMINPTFPSKLRHLAFQFCYLIQPQISEQFFTSLHTKMQFLEELEISSCRWFRGHSIMAVSKLSKLRVFRLTGCRGLFESMTYFSLACRFGFKSLEILDLRDSLISDSELGCVGLIQSLTHLYLQRPHEPRSDGRKKYDLSQDGDEFPDLIFAEKSKCNCWTERLDARQGIGDCAQWINILPVDTEDQVTDIGICNLGCTRQTPSLPNVVTVRMDGVNPFFHNPALHTLVARGYTSITDSSLRHLSGVESLQSVDLSGTSVTANGIEHFRCERPLTELVMEEDWKPCKGPKSEIGRPWGCEYCCFEASMFRIHHVNEVEIVQHAALSEHVQGQETEPNFKILKFSNNSNSRTNSSEPSTSGYHIPQVENIDDDTKKNHIEQDGVTPSSSSDSLPNSEEITVSSGIVTAKIDDER